MTIEPDRFGLRVRHGGPDDAVALAALMCRVPSRDAVAMAGSAQAAERFQALLFRHALGSGPSATLIVAESDAGLAGFAEVVLGSEGTPMGAMARAAIEAMGVIGALRSAVRWTARRGVLLDPPPGGVHLEELHVAPEMRNRGVGAFLLARVEEHAAARDAACISLTTAIDNPARRLYERHGYRLTGERTDARYERLTGSPGRVLLVKELLPAG